MRETLPLFGKSCLVTGATSGIGLASACALAGLGAAVTGVGRDEARIAAALETIARRAKASGAPPPAMVKLDLGSLPRVAAFAADFVASGARLDILVNCAGVYTPRRQMTSDGLETQFAVNHLAPFLLTTRLIPALEKSDDARVITVSSDSHRFGRIHWRDVSLGRLYTGISAYAQSKLANALFSAELARRLGGETSLTVLTADPGLANTEMGSKGGNSPDSYFWRIRRRGGTSPEVPAEAIAWLASEPSLKGKTGLYWKDRLAIVPARAATSAASASRLWALSEDMIRKITG